VRRTVALALVACVATAGLLVAADASVDAGTSTAGADRVVERMRAAARDLQFTGSVRMTWRVRGAEKSVTVTVTGNRGVIEVNTPTDQASVFDRDGLTYYKGKLGGWQSALIGPNPRNIPPPDHAWRITLRAGPEIAGRPTDAVVARRSNGLPALRLFVDTETGLLLQREVLDARGVVERSVGFTDLTLAAPNEARGPSGVAPRYAKRLTSVPDGFVVPHAPSGYVLVSQSEHDGVVELLYTDGLFTVSVSEQRGDLDWDALPKGGVASEIGGNRARRYVQPGADVLVWERDGVVYTGASDAPSDVVDAMIAEFAPDRSTLEQVADFVLGPFGWS
jgi:sigma-E factor negative regulatory protein RseB